MNFDELKKQWDNQSGNEVEINPELELNKEAGTVIDKVRKTLKKDFFFQITTFPILLLYPFLFGVNTPLIWFIVFCYTIIMIIPLKKMMNFYNTSYKLEYNSLKNINWFYYNYQFSIDIFKIYSNVLCILIVMFIGITSFEKGYFNDNQSIIFLILLIIFYVIFCICITNWWINKLYKKPLLELKSIVDQLEE